MTRPVTSSSEPAVTSERRGDITIVTLSRPARRNAVDGETAELLRDAFLAFESDDTARVAVLYGARGTFCAGADLKAIAQAKPGAQLSVALDPEGPGPMGPTRDRLSKPVIAAIAGHAVAGGLELALWCDLRVAEEDAILGVFCRRFGVPLIDGGTVRLPRLIGMGHALDLILTGRPVDAQEALQMGLVNRVVPRGESLARAVALARELARFPQACMRTDRRSAYEQWEHPERLALTLEARGGLPVLERESIAGARRFSAGAGRHGGFEADMTTKSDTENADE